VRPVHVHISLLYSLNPGRVSRGYDCNKTDGTV